MWALVRLLELSKNPKAAIFAFECNTPKLRLIILKAPKRKEHSERKKEKVEQIVILTFSCPYLYIRFFFFLGKNLFIRLSIVTLDFVQIFEEDN